MTGSEKYLLSVLEAAELSLFILSYPTRDHERVFYLDAYGNKYVARGGTLSWRINNPGLVHSHRGVVTQRGAIGACGQFAIFPDAATGHEALVL